MRPLLIHTLLGMHLSTEAPAPTPSEPPERGTTAESRRCVAHVSDVPGMGDHDARLHARHLIVVRKAARTVQLFSRGAAVTGSGMGERACYRIGLGFTPEGPKAREGDGRTPEGWYTTSDKPWSTFYAAIAVHYPNAADARAGAASGRISPRQSDAILAAEVAGRKPAQTTPLGGEILLHGGGSSTDWTLGCIALEDADIDDLRTHLPPSMAVVVRILP